MATKFSDNPPEVPPPADVASLLITKRLVADRLTPYISLYSRRSSSVPSSSAAKSDRIAILQWFSSLSVHHRLSYLTVVDRSFAQILLQMLSKLRSLGHCTFITLPDLPESRDLPSLCHRRSQGFMARIAESNASERMIRDSVRLFNSNEGEGESVENCSSYSAGCIDTVTFNEGFVMDVDHFVEVMDKVSDGGFLMSEWDEMGADLVEFGWLEAQGYFSMEAFVANRVEVALRSAWLSCNSGKKRGVKLKEKISRVGVAVNVYWRKKGCVDWWKALDVRVKRKSLQMALGKTAKFLVGDILRGAENPLDAEMGLFKGAGQSPRYNFDIFSDRSEKFAEFGNYAALTSYSGSDAAQLPFDIKNLLVLQDIIALWLASNCGEYDGEKLFFSSLDSLITISDYILRKMRAVLMVVSLESKKIELLEGGELKVPQGKPKEKFGGSSRRKKGKNHGVKKPDPNSKSQIDYAIVNTLKEPAQGLVAQKVPAAGRKNSKEQRRKKHSGRKVNASNGIQSPLPIGVKDIPCIELSSGIIDHSNVLCVNGEKGVSSGVDKDEIHSLLRSNSLIAPLKDDVSSTGADNFIDLAEGIMIPCLECCPSRSRTWETVDAGFKTKCVDIINPSEIPAQLRGKKLESSTANPGSCGESEDQSGGVQMSLSYQTIQENMNETMTIHEQKISNVNNGEAALSNPDPSYEWPSLASLHFPCSNPCNLPPATDRLHLEVGQNWRNHSQQSSMQQLYQVRDTQIDRGCGKVLSLSLSLNLDSSPVVRNANGLASSLTCNYDPGFVAMRPSPLQPGFNSQGANLSALSDKEERHLVDFSDPTTTQELTDECDGRWVSEEECDVHTTSCIDYSRYFGGGIMYWNPSDYREAGFSRPPSLSSDDSSWACHEADMNRTVDDMVAFSSYSTNGLASPSTASFSSPFEASAAGHHAHGYVMSGNEISGKLLNSCSVSLEAKEEGATDGDAKSLDSFPYPILRPIVIPSLSRERSKSEFMRNHDLRSPCIPPSRREQHRIKRPPSPVVLCVPRSPRPPPPSPVSDARKQRGFATVRSGSSSPRHWGVRGWFHDGNNFDEACVCMDGAEMVWPSWGGKNFSSSQLVQPLSGALLEDQLIAISQLTHDHEHPDVTFPLQPSELLNCPKRMGSLPLIHDLLHDEIDFFCKQVAAENLIRRPYINWAVKRVTRSLQVLWPRSRTSIFGSNATGLSLPTSDVDLVVCLPPVRNLEPIKEAGILEGRNGIKETCLQHAARYLANQEWVKADSLKTVENTAIPIIMLVVEVPTDLICSALPTSQRPSERMQPCSEDGISHRDIGGQNSISPIPSDVNYEGDDVKSIRLDISFKSPSHTGLQTAELIKQLSEQFPATIPLALVLKQFLADRTLDQSYSGGLSSYCLVLLIIRFLQHEHHHGRPTNQNLGSIFMDFLYFFGNVFDPRRMRISIQGSGLYISRERGYSIDPIYIDDPLFPTNNVGKNCFRIHQCIKAFADAYSTLEDEITCLVNQCNVTTGSTYRLLPKIIPSISCSKGNSAI